MGQGRSRWDRKKVLHRHHDALSALDWREFECLLADYYREQGYEVDHNGTGGKGFAFDGGVDLRLRAQRDAEAKAYLERVPELTHYKYSPLDANKDPPADAGTPTR